MKSPWKFNQSLVAKPENVKSIVIAHGDDNNPGQQLYHARAEKLGELGLPRCDEALSGMGGASLTNEVPRVM